MNIGRTIKIINNQIKAYSNEPLEGLELIYNEIDALKVEFLLTGPKNSPWEDCIMNGYIDCPKDYPFNSPNVIFTTKTYHPNIYNDGKVCLSILNNTRDETGYFQQSELWSPALDFRCIMLCVINLFHEPNLESPANLDACILYRKLFDSQEKTINVDIKELKL
jgi:ubiquitin-protein ligase